MRLTVLLLWLAASLQAATILPERWIELVFGGGGESTYSIQADDGFFITGGFDPYGGGRGSGGPDEFGRVRTWWHSFGLDVYVTSVSSPWVSGQGFAAEGDGIGLEIVGPECELAVACGPFTFYGYLESDGARDGSPVWPLRYELSGQGTAYATFWPDPQRDGVSTVRYEFEAIQTPEPSTWGLLLIGVGAACWLGQKSR